MLNEIELTILTLAAEGSRYGSEIDQLIDQRGLREWLTIGSTSAVYVLGKLEHQQLISSAQDATGKYVYQITEAGRGVLQTAVSNLLAQPRSPGTGFELALANLKALKPPQVYQSLKQRQVALRQQLQATDQLRASHQQDENGGDELNALYSHSAALLRAELIWLDEFLRDWRCRYPTLEPEGEDRHATQISRSTAPQRSVKNVQRLPRPPGAD